MSTNPDTPPDPEPSCTIRHRFAEIGHPAGPGPPRGPAGPEIRDDAGRSRRQDQADADPIRIP
jgi:hypothetical protein